MLNFYQSDIWKDINKNIYMKDIFEVIFLWKKYWWVIKKKSKLNVEFKWYQILWITLETQFSDNTILLENEIKKLKDEFKKSFWDIFLQLWFINELSSTKTSKLHKENNIIKNKCRIDRLTNDHYMKTLGLNSSFRENMPLATIIINLNKWTDELFQDIRKSWREKIKKAIKRWVEFQIAKKDDWEDFYNTWNQTANLKWFNIMSLKIFKKLQEYLIANNYWNLFLCKKNNEIVSWSLCLFIWNTIVFLYWATNRKFGNIWWHQLLKYKIFERWHTNNYKTFDLLGGAPTWFENHHLVWVSKFKESLWWEKIEFLWNYDLVFNPLIYNIFKFSKGH
jgi:lipid II:glycine glycyltransferase (peptidoglycan interpeptide bridge formation enzyme)